MSEFNGFRNDVFFTNVSNPDPLTQSNAGVGPSFFFPCTGIQYQEGAWLDEDWMCYYSPSGGCLPGPSLEMQIFPNRRVPASTKNRNAVI